MKKLLVILGPTATGKTDLAIKLAKKFNGEIVSCDSRQVYKGLDIGTGKLSSGRWKMEDGRWKKRKGFWEIDGIKIWIYDVADPRKQYTVADYVKEAERVIREIKEMGKLPIIVGGTGLYLKAILEGLPNLSIPVDQVLRKKLKKLSKEKLQEKLQEVNPDKWKSLNESDRENPRRLVRAIELSVLNHEGGSSPASPVQDDKLRLGIVRSLSNMHVLKIGLIAPREVLYRRVDEGVVTRIQQGMVTEAERLHKNGLSLKRMRQLGLEYGVLADYLDGSISSKEQLITNLQNRIHGYVRRQLTWFKKEKDVFWFDITSKNFSADVEKKILKWYDPGNVAKG